MKGWYVVNTQTWCVCGGRNFTEYLVVRGTLDHLSRSRGLPRLLVTGGCPTGADHDAGQWAMDHRVRVICVQADWARHGRNAGPIRNRQILSIHHPDLLIAFPGGPGTADMTNACEDAQTIEILRVECRDVSGN